MTKKTKILVSIFAVLVIPYLLTAQSFKKNVDVEYLQLPAIADNFSTADIFITLDNSSSRDIVNAGLGKLGLSGDSKSKEGKNIDLFVKEVFSDQTDKFADWNLFEGFALNKNTGNLKIVLTFSPDDSARAMMAPTKSSAGIYKFRYRVNSSMKVYDADEKLLHEAEFAAISGNGRSKRWEEGPGTGDNGYTAYEEGCRDGVVEYAKNVIYGMYGVKKLTSSLGVAEIKKQKGSKDYQGKFNTLVASRSGNLLDQKAIIKAQTCIDYWESILSSTKEKYLWAVHYNLAIAYSWILDAANAEMHIMKVAELNSKIFDNIKTKKGSFTGGDLKILEAYNIGHPFSMYYAKGINKYPSIVAMLDIDAYRVAHTMAINQLIANVVDLPVALPLYPVEKKTGMKKCEGSIKFQDNAIANFSYDLKKGKMESLQIKGVKKTKLDDLKQTFSITKAADLHPSELRRVYYSSDMGNVRGNYGLTAGPQIFLNSYKAKAHNLMPAYRLEDKNIHKKMQEIEGSFLGTQFTNSNFVEESLVSGGEWLYNKFELGDSMYVSICAENTVLKAEALNIAENGIPTQYKVSMDIKDAKLSLDAHIKTKFGETTNSEQSRRRKLQSRIAPAVRKMIMDHLIEVTEDFTQNDKKLSFVYSDTYDLNVTNDSKGNWTNIEIGEYTITREIKY